MTSPTATTTPRRRGRPAGGSPAADEASVLDAALELFADVGYDGASVRDLCRRLGVSHNLLHQRYGSKERLWYAAVDRGFRDLAEEFIDAATGASDDLDELRRVMVRFLEVAALNPSLLRIINAESARGGPRLDHIVDAYLAPAMALMEEGATRLRDAGHLRPISTPVLYVLVTHGAGGVLALGPLADRLGMGELRRDPASVRRYAEDVVDLILAGLLVG